MMNKNGKLFGKTSSYEYQYIQYISGIWRSWEPEEITSKGTRVSCVYYQ